MNEYNGWPNKETWHVSLAVNSAEDIDVVRATLEELMADLADQQFYVAADLLLCAMDNVDWERLRAVYSE